MSSSSHVVVVTGASGAGKTAVVSELAARAIPGVQCFHFDSVGVPSAEVMEAEFGGGEGWQAAATREWVRRLGELSSEVRIAVLDGQTRPSFVFAAAAESRRSVHVVLLDCDPETRATRLRGPRGQPELVTAQMDSWAAYLRGQADALQLPVIDTSSLSVDEATDQLAQIMERLVDNASL